MSRCMGSNGVLKARCGALCAGRHVSYVFAAEDTHWLAMLGPSCACRSSSNPILSITSPFSAPVLQQLHKSAPTFANLVHIKPFVKPECQPVNNLIGHSAAAHLLGQCMDKHHLQVWCDKSLVAGNQISANRNTYHPGQNIFEPTRCTQLQHLCFGIQAMKSLAEGREVPYGRTEASSRESLQC